MLLNFFESIILHQNLAVPDKQIHRIGHAHEIAHSTKKGATLALLQVRVFEREKLLRLVYVSCIDCYRFYHHLVVGSGHEEDTLIYFEITKT